MKKVFKLFLIVVFTVICFLCSNQKVNASDNKTYEGIEFQPWEDATALPTEGNYYLTADVNLAAPTPYVSRTIAIDKTLNLDLNGHTIKHYGNNQTANYTVFYVNGGTLSIYDSVGTGLITNCGICCIWINKGTFNLYGGKISGNDYLAPALNEYGGVYVDGNSQALFNMYGGEITGNGNGNRDIHAYGAINFYGGHVGNVMIFTAYSDNLVSICGGSSTPLIIDRITIGKDLHMTNGKIAAGSKINFEVYGSEKNYDDEAIVTSGFAAAGYTSSDLSMFGTVKAAETSTLLDCALIDNEIKLIGTCEEHDLEFHEGKEATCEEDGLEDYYQCKVCSKYFLESDDTDPVDYADLTISKLGHDMTHHEAVSASCTKEGTVEYWTCSHESGIYYEDEEATTTLDTIAVSKLDHNAGQPEYVWNEDYTECVATVYCTECHNVIHTESGTVTRDAAENKATATFSYPGLDIQTVNLPSTEPDPEYGPIEPIIGKAKCGMHWILLVLTILYLAFYACWYTVLKDKEFKFLPAKIAKKLFPLFVSALMLLLVLIFGIIGMTKGCGACIAFFIVDVLLIGLAAALYFFDEKLLALFKKEEKKEEKVEEQAEEQQEENK